VLPSDIALNTEIPDAPLIVSADPNQLLQVLLNLAHNARDALAGPGTITIRVAPSPSGGARLSVSDTGPGIPPDVLPRVFEPFYTTKAPGEGTGLGMSNVKTIVEDLGGTVSVQSELGQGTTVELEFPTTEHAVETDAPASLVAPSRGESVLVVDDDVRVRAVVFAALQRKGYQVLEAPSPAFAELLLRDTRTKIDLVLTDVVMQDGGGSRVLDMLPQARPDAAVLVISGYNASETLRRGVSQGKLPFLAKPFTADQLCNAVEAAITAKRSSAAV
jgi:CheY-like chemotaxis protein